MKDLLLMAVEKFIDEPKSFFILVVVCFAGIACVKAYKKHVSRTIYLDKELLRVNRLYLRKMTAMSIPLFLMTHFLLSYSNYLHNDYTNQPFLFIVYSIPLLVLTTCQNIVKIMKEDKFGMGKAILAVMPGLSTYIFFYCFLLAANKSIWLLVIVAVIGVMTPAIVDVITVLLVSEKSKVKVKIFTSDGNIYDINKKDFIEGYKEATLKLRDAQGRVNQSIFISNEKIAKKEYYRVEKK